MKNILNIIKYLSAIFAVLVMFGPATAQRQNAPLERVQISIADISIASLPPEAREVLNLIEKGGPYPFDRDGIVFGNFEKRLPIKARGYYHEYTVKTPGIKHRGARRIVTGKGGEKFYSDDHYNTFKRVVP